ncbi:hypothetical protein AAZV13_02G059800 [Glycine max]|uniref:Uncharacterized protein n=1 Tax=Glycine max TaxID=3847 RepID=K7K6T3_SOYBN|nr:hypothetical protein GYH30_003220 [Glycine max]
MLRVAARRLSSLSFSSPWWHNHAASAYVSRNAVVEDRRSAPSSHPLVPFRGFATESLIHPIENNIIPEILPSSSCWVCLASDLCSFEIVTVTLRQDLDQ